MGIVAVYEETVIPWCCSRMIRVCTSTVVNTMSLGRSLESSERGSTHAATDADVGVFAMLEGMADYASNVPSDGSAITSHLSVFPASVPSHALAAEVMECGPSDVNDSLAWLTTLLHLVAESERNWNKETAYV